MAQIYTGAVSASAGGTGRATVDAGTASFLNPAALVHQKGRQIYTAFGKDDMAVSLNENSPDSALPTSFAYWQKNSTLLAATPNSLDKYKQQDIRLSIAEFVKTIWAVGLTGHYYQVQNQEKTLGQWNVDLGLTVTPVPNIGFALIFYDMGGVNNQIPEELRLLPKVGLGFHHIYREYFRSRMDLVSGPNEDFRKSTLMLGFETYLNQWVITRFGYQNNTYLKQDLLSLGFGFDLPKFRTNYAYQFVASDSKDQRHSVDLAIPF